jgi:hypothetical protein
MVDPVEQEVADILSLKRRGARINAHHKMKKLQMIHPQSVAVARGVVQTAQGVKAWGEAYDAAEFWMTHSNDPEAGTVFAKLQRATLRGNPVTTLQKVVESHPDFAPARVLLAKYQGEKLATR